MIIGHEYLRNKGDEADPRVLIDLICPSSPIERGSLGREDSGELRSSVTKRVRADFERGRIVEICGWILSETEVRLCSLTALSPPQPLLPRINGRPTRAEEVR